ncbi:MAG: PilZ domain-containing protein [Candidatus Omnitrophica bacterium]|nr:PilZ domain-containing protein [Candidatus Omnitrophota bacterium]
MEKRISHRDKEVMEMEDRRIFARISIKIPLKFLDPRCGKKGEAVAVDISANGVGFITKERLAPKTALEMWLDVADQQGPVHTQGEVVWCKCLADGKQQRVGVRLENGKLIELARVLWVKNKG